MKFALVQFGNEESYGLLYAATEFKKHGEIRFFDAEMDDPVDDIKNYSPDFVCFSPMTTFYNKAKELEIALKSSIDFVSIYGGHHASNCGYQCGDITCVGGVSGIDLSKRGIINGGLVKSSDLVTPAREEYFRDIPRMKERYRKILLSVVGCPFKCTYCSSKHSKELLIHRSIDDVIREAEFIKDCTYEVEWVDDDIFAGDSEWLIEFFEIWNKKIKLPMYVSTTSVNALKATSELLKLMRYSVNCIGMGIQAIRPESLKLMGRSWDNYHQMKQAYDRLTAYGFNVNLQGIIGLPISDPIEDAIDTIEAMTSIGKGSIVSVYPLQIYPNTPMEKYCKIKGFRLNKDCNGDTNSGMPGIDFGDSVNYKIRNLCKLATMIVKFGIDKKWIYALLDIKIDDVSRNLSLIRYYECVKERLPENFVEVFTKIMGTTNVRF